MKTIARFTAVTILGLAASLSLSTAMAAGHEQHQDKPAEHSQHGGGQGGMMNHGQQGDSQSGMMNHGQQGESQSGMMNHGQQGDTQGHMMEHMQHGQMPQGGEDVKPGKDGKHANQCDYGARDHVGLPLLRVRLRYGPERGREAAGKEVGRGIETAAQGCRLPASDSGGPLRLKPVQELRRCPFAVPR